MRSGWLRFLCFGVMLHALTATSQSRTITEDGSSMKGKLVAEPERFSGLWETADGSEGAIGIWLLLRTSVQGDTTTLRNVPQLEESFSVSLFRRTGNHLEFGNGSSFADEPDGQMMWDGKHLRAQRGLRNDDASTIQLDLTYDARREIWSGLYRRGGIARTVKLRRPASALVAATHALVGTWENTDRGSLGCFHIVRAVDGALLGWSDGLRAPGTLRYANGLQPPTSTFEHYGNLLLVSEIAPWTVSIEFGAYSGICCSSTLIAKVGPNATLLGDWQPGPNRIAGKSVWKKLNGESCRVQE
jgi:hypothetical protein